VQSTLTTLLLGACACWALAAVLFAVLRPTRQWLIRRRRQFAIGITSSVFTLALCDLALTALGIVPTIAELRNRNLEYRPTAFTRHRLLEKHTTINGQPVSINSRGYLGPEISPIKPPGKRRIVFLGGSQVFGAYWADGKDWPTEAGTILNQTGHGVEVINAGIPNHQTGDAVGKLFADLWSVEPDVVVVCNAWNDIKYFAELDPQRPYLHVAAPTSGLDPRLHPAGIDWLMCYSSLYRIVHPKLIRTLHGQGDEGEVLRKPILRTAATSLRQYRLNLQAICDIGQNIGARVVLCKQARLVVPDSPNEQRKRIPYEFTGLAHDELIRAFAACDTIVEQVAAEKGCHVIDMHTILSGRDELFADHIHFTLLGCQQAAQVVADGLTSILVRPSGGVAELGPVGYR
jgi:hypothetical protein